jgi:GT2 family glycosyltransferase
VPQYSPTSYKYTVLLGQQGLCLQRNRALSEAQKRSDLITFFDDDFLPAPDYLENVEKAFIEHPDWAVLRGVAVQDGAKGPGLSFDAGLIALEEASSEYAPSIETRFSEQVGGYGCNMSIRTSVIKNARFDERLPLYGWQEDIDFSNQLRSRGRVLELNTLYGVHLGAKQGRVSGLRLGYSQIINPIYLVRKGTMPTGFALNLIFRNFFANLVKSFWPEPYIDRFGRLRGNFLGVFHLIRGRIDPEYILKL